MRLKCTICLCLYQRDSEICALLCGHLYHIDCINHWLSTNSSCPSCRKRVQRNKIVEKLYLELEDHIDSSENLERQSNEIFDVQTKLKQAEMELRACDKKFELLEKNIEQEQNKSAVLEVKYSEEQILTKSLKRKVEQMKVQQEDINRAKLEVHTMREYLTQLKSVELVVRGSVDEVTNMISDCGEGSASVRQLATLCVTLKRELEILKRAKRQLKEQNDEQKTRISKQQREISQKNEQIKHLEKDMEMLKMNTSCGTPQPVSRVKYINEFSTPVAFPTTLRYANTEKNDLLSADVCVSREDSARKNESESNDSSNNKRQQVVNNRNEESKPASQIGISGIRNVTKRPKLEPEINPILVSFGIMKKRTHLNGSKMSVRTGYNGLGSHEKYIASNKTTTQAKMSSFFNM